VDFRNLLDIKKQSLVTPKPFQDPSFFTNHSLSTHANMNIIHMTECMQLEKGKETLKLKHGSTSYIKINEV
jgi:hypothetical protein